MHFLRRTYRHSIRQDSFRATHRACLEAAWKPEYRDPRSAMRSTTTLLGTRADRDSGRTRHTTRKWIRLPSLTSTAPFWVAVGWVPLRHCAGPVYPASGRFPALFSGNRYDGLRLRLQRARQPGQLHRHAPVDEPKFQAGHRSAIQPERRAPVARQHCADCRLRGLAQRSHSCQPGQ